MCAETGKMILANLGFYNLKGTSGFKTIAPVGAKICIETYLVASYDHTRLNGGCKF
jgi:hypothetical protein